MKRVALSCVKLCVLASACILVKGERLRVSWCHSEGEQYRLTSRRLLIQE